MSNPHSCLMEFYFLIGKRRYEKIQVVLLSTCYFKAKSNVDLDFFGLIPLMYVGISHWKYMGLLKEEGEKSIHTICLKSTK